MEGIVAVRDESQCVPGVYLLVDIGTVSALVTGAEHQCEIGVLAEEP